MDVKRKISKGNLGLLMQRLAKKVAFRIPGGVGVGGAHSIIKVPRTEVCRILCYFFIFGYHVAIARNFCGSFILRIGDFFVVCGNKFLRYAMTEISAGN